MMIWKGDKMLESGNREMDFLETGRSPATGKRGAVTTPHYLATQAGENIIRRGGHAVEAAIASNAVLSVVYPHMAGIGGDLFALIKDEGEDDVRAMNGSGKAAGTATIDFFKEKGYDSIPEEGPLSSGTVPGAVAAWEAMHEKYGRLDWAELFEEAIYHAEEGFPVTEKLADFILQEKDKIDQHDKTAAVFIPDGEPLKAKDILVQGELAETLKSIAKEGASAFYEGEVGEKMTASLQDAGGLLSMEDLKNHESEWQDPISTTYRDDYEVYQLKPNTQGVAALMMLNIFNQFDFNRLRDNTPQYYHLMAEAAKITFQYRDQWVTDPDKEHVPVDELLSDEQTTRMMDHFSEDKANLQEDLNRLPALKTNRDTTYFAAVDGEGNAVSMIQSVYHEFGSGFMADGGFLLQNRGSFFSLDGNHINRLEPGKKTFHTIMPAMVMKDGRPYLLMGSMGGEGQPQTQSALFTRIVDFGYNVQQAIEAPRWLYGRTWGDDSDSLKFEKRVADSNIEALESLGHEVEILPAYSQTMGHAQAIRIEDGLYEAGADPRGDGIALSW